MLFPFIARSGSIASRIPPGLIEGLPICRSWLVLRGSLAGPQATWGELGESWEILGRCLAVLGGSLGGPWGSLGSSRGGPGSTEIGDGSLGVSWEGPGRSLGWFWRSGAILASVLGGPNINTSLVLGVF